MEKGWRPPGLLSAPFRPNLPTRLRSKHAQTPVLLTIMHAKKAPSSSTHSALAAAARAFLVLILNARSPPIAACVGGGEGRQRRVAECGERSTPPGRAGQTTKKKKGLRRPTFNSRFATRPSCRKKTKLAAPQRAHTRHHHHGRRGRRHGLGRPAAAVGGAGGAGALCVCVVGRRRPCAVCLAGPSGRQQCAAAAGWWQAVETTAAGALFSARAGRCR